MNEQQLQERHQPCNAIRARMNFLINLLLFVFNVQNATLATSVITSKVLLWMHAQLYQKRYPGSKLVFCPSPLNSLQTVKLNNLGDSLD